jgi:hypothetical protein
MENIIPTFNTDKQFSSEEFINDIFELKKPLFTVKIKDDSEESIINLYADGSCPYEIGKENTKISISIFNNYRAALSIALGSPAIRAILLKDGKLSNFIAPYLESKD